jgi:phage tail-like protein
MASLNNPYPAFNFLVVIDGVTKAGFSECSGISITTEVIKYRTGAEDPSPRKVEGQTEYGNITLKRGMIQDKGLWEWRKRVLDGQTLRASGSITLRDTMGNDKVRYAFSNAWPTKLEGPAFNAKNNEVAVETLEMAVEKVEVQFL